MCKKKHSDGQSTLFFHPRDDKDERIESVIEKIKEQLEINAIKGEFMFDFEGNELIMYNGFLVTDEGEIKEWSQLHTKFLPYKEACKFVESKMPEGYRLATLNEVREDNGANDDEIREIAQQFERIRIDG